MNRIHKEICLALVAAMAFWGCQSAYSEEVSVPAALPAIEPTGPTPSDISAAAASDPLQAAMLFHVPANTDAYIALPSSSAPRIPVVASSATASDTRLGVDLSAANAASDGWPWYGKAALIAGCVILVGLSAWAIVAACESGGSSSGDDSSTRYGVVVGGEGNTVHVRIDSPESSSSSTTPVYW